MGTGLDLLVIENFILFKDNQSAILILISNMVLKKINESSFNFFKDLFFIILIVLILDITLGKFVHKKFIKKNYKM